MNEDRAQGVIANSVHRELERGCPISKTPCLGECTCSDILDDIGLCIIRLDIRKQRVFFQNKRAIEIFKGSIQPKDYDVMPWQRVCEHIIATVTGFSLQTKLLVPLQNGG